MDENGLQTIKTVRKRAESTRNFAKLSMFGIVVVAITMISFFSINTDSFFSYDMPVTRTYNITESPSAKLSREEVSVIQAVKSLEEKVDKAVTDAELKRNFQDTILYSLSVSVVRIASVFLAVYLIQILVGFTRYQFRLSDHLDATADALELTAGDQERLDTVLKSISTQHIDFGKMPNTPTEHSMELLKELVKKIPSK